MKHVLYALALSSAFITSASSVPRDVRTDFVRSDRIAFPEDAPYSPQAATLGRMLFFDPRLSGAQNMSCATCHNPSFGWETPVARAIGALNQPLARHVPTIENLAEAHAFFWDGRAPSLEAQAVGPITHPKEMNARLEVVVERLTSIGTYRRSFTVAFPDEGLTAETILRAIATYERTLRSGWSPFDDWVDGDETAISDAAKRGFELFLGKAQCATCHVGWSFTDHQFHAIGIRSSDLGRGVFEDGAAYTFKTPGLRNIILRAPYMHDGSLATLRDVVDHYRHIGSRGAMVDPVLLAISLNDADTEDILAFLQTLTAYDPHVRAPALPIN